MKTLDFLTLSGRDYVMQHLKLPQAINIDTALSWLPESSPKQTHVKQICRGALEVIDADIVRELHFPSTSLRPSHLQEKIGYLIDSRIDEAVAIYRQTYEPKADPDKFPLPSSDTHIFIECYAEPLRSLCKLRAEEVLKSALEAHGIKKFFPENEHAIPIKGLMLQSFLASAAILEVEEADAPTLQAVRQLAQSAASQGLQLKDIFPLLESEQAGLAARLEAIFNDSATHRMALKPEKDQGLSKFLALLADESHRRNCAEAFILDSEFSGFAEKEFQKLPDEEKKSFNNDKRKVWIDGKAGEFKIQFMQTMERVFETLRQQILEEGTVRGEDVYSSTIGAPPARFFAQIRELTTNVFPEGSEEQKKIIKCNIWRIPYDL